MMVCVKIYDEVKKLQRIRVADALRGLSLAGIFLANLLIFQYGLSGKEYIEFYHLNTVNTGAFHFIKIFIEGSFMPIFAILFGFSLDKMYQSMKRKNIKRPRIKLYRRAFLLFVIGTIHTIWIWEGDILSGYALSMMLLIPFISLTKSFFKWGTVLVAITFIIMVVFSFFDDTDIPHDTHKEGTFVQETKDLYQQGSYSEIISESPDNSDPYFEQLKAVFGVSPGILLLCVIIFESLVFGIGIYLSKSGWFEMDANDFWSNKLFVYLTPVVLLLKSSYLWFDNENITGTFNFVFGLFLALCYIALFKYLYQKYTQHIIFRSLESLGKMSLTFYITQSIIGVLIFYGFGLGQFGKDTLFYNVIIFIILFLIQMVIAFWYQKYLRYGPLEYVLRVFTYWTFKKQSWR